MKNILSVIFICSLLNCAAQQNYYQGHSYQLSENILSALAKDTARKEKSGSYQSAATELSYMGDYKNTLTVWDSCDFKSPHLSVQDSLYFLHCRPVDAHKYIIERAKHEQIIILNEAHHIPLHRVFTESLLHDLHKIGFSYFGGETFSKNDPELNSRKYPVGWTGTYSNQPCYGNMVRTALQEGYHVFAYEADLSDPNTTSKEREIQQAKNIKTILDRDPKAKIVIHCGYDHLIETKLPVWEKAMAGRLKEYTGIDPFTIDQTRLTEKGLPEFENPFFKMVNLDYDAVFIDSTGKAFNGQRNINQYDLRVYHPRTKWVSGRPDWVFKNNRRPYFINDQVKVDFPCLVLAFVEGEDEKIAVPADVIELKNKEDKTALALKKGKYKVIIRRNTTNDQEPKIQL